MGIAAGLAGQAAGLGSRFRSARPFPHLVVDGLLEHRLLTALQQQFPAFDPDRARNELGEPGRKAVYQGLAALGPAYAEFDRLIQSAAFLEWMGRATGIANLLYDPEYIGGGAHLNLNGQDLDQHVDFNYHPRTGFHRRLNLILFLNEQWHEDWGGCLELHADPRAPRDRDEMVAVVPQPNRAVIFETSERSWHGFRRVAMPEEFAALGRRSLAVYFYTREAPAHAAPSHGTIYVPPPLPDRLQPGHTLTAEDVHELQVMLQRRDTQIEYLYGREMEFSRILHSPTGKLARMLTAPVRWLKRR